jgi:malonyl-CoA O-methyltransferase
MDVPRSLDWRLIRRRFDRAALCYDRAAVLQREAGARMLERLDLVKLQPRRVLDAGSGTGALRDALRGRYPGAALVELDLSLAMLKAGVRGGLWQKLAGRLRGRGRLRVCADLERLPLATASVELICSNFALEWVGRPARAFAEFHRVLASGGLLMFATLGPDTLKELRAALAEEPHPPPAHPLMDMHDLGDLLMQTGFAEPVMDMEYMTLTYDRLADLLRDLRESGMRGGARSPVPGLTGRGWLARLARRYEGFRRDGRLPATFEIVYGHAWKPQPGRSVTEDGRAVISLERLRSKPNP